MTHFCWATKMTAGNQAVHRRTACAVSQMEDQSSVLGDGKRYPTEPDIFITEPPMIRPDDDPLTWVMLLDQLSEAHTHLGELIAEIERDSQITTPVRWCNWGTSTVTSTDFGMDARSQTETWTNSMRTRTVHFPMTLLLRNQTRRLSARPRSQ